MSFELAQLMRKILFLPPAVTKTAASIDRLHFFVITTTMLGAVVVAICAIYWLVRYRRRDRPEATEHIVAPTWFEATWISGLLALFILWWVIGFRQYIEIAAAPADSEEVYVSAKQWMWKFSHPGGRSSVGVLVVPRGRPVRLIMTSRDVIHSFYVPAFRIKQDVLPGRYTTAWFEAEQVGRFKVLCAEFCGTLHSRMRASVVVLPPEDFERWLDGEVPELVAEADTGAQLAGYTVDSQPAEQSMAQRGQDAAAQYGCFACHTIDGQPHIGPTWYRLYGSQVTFEDGATTVADEQYLTNSMMDPQAQVVRGYDNVMPTYLGSIPQAEAAAIVEFIKSLDKTELKPAVQLPHVTADPDSSRTTQPALDDVQAETPPTRPRAQQSEQSGLHAEPSKAANATSSTASSGTSSAPRSPAMPAESLPPQNKLPPSKEAP